MAMSEHDNGFHLGTLALPASGCEHDSVRGDPVRRFERVLVATWHSQDEPATQVYGDIDGAIEDGFRLDDVMWCAAHPGQTRRSVNDFHTGTTTLQAVSVQRRLTA